MNLITATQLNQWADSIESRHLLPELVKKLVYATKIDLIRVEIPTHEQVQYSGWDGVVDSTNRDQFLPSGICLMEMGTNKDVKAKADSDYEKRSNDSLGYDKKHGNFIFITPRDWSGARDWEQKRNNEQ